MGHEHKPADVYPALLKAFNAGDIDATVACYEPQACFVLKSGHALVGLSNCVKCTAPHFHISLT
jgi:hypothetical protein